MHPAQRLSVHAVTDQFQAFVPEFLKSLDAQDDRSFQLTLIDNASPDRAKAVTGDNVTILRNPKRQSWAKAHNQALALAFSRWGNEGLEQRAVCITTTRAVLAPEALGQLMATLDRDAALAIVCPKILASRVILADDGEAQEFELGNRIITAGGLMAKGRRPIWRGAGEMDSAAWSGVSEVFFPHPALFIVRASHLKVLAASGPWFDETLDPLAGVIDLAWRLKLLGGRAVCVERAVTWVQSPPQNRTTRRVDGLAAMQAASRSDAMGVRIRHLPWILLERLRLLLLGGVVWPSLARWRLRALRSKEARATPSEMAQWFV